MGGISDHLFRLDQLVTPRLLREAYLATEVQLFVDGEWISGERAACEIPRPLFVLTAWNPWSQARSREENDSANLALEAAIYDEGGWLYPAVGRSPDGEWFEESFAVTGISRRTARRLGRQFGQHAIFQLSRNELIVRGSVSNWFETYSYRSDQTSLKMRDQSLESLLAKSRAKKRQDQIAPIKSVGWFEVGGTGLSCPSCDAPLTACVREFWSEDGDIHAESVWMCGNEEKVFAETDLADGYVRTTDRRRRYLDATRDTDRSSKGKSRYSVYVIQLESSITEKPDLYVGQTTKTVEERFSEHQSGVRTSSKISQRAVTLRKDLVPEKTALRTKAEAETYEAWLAEWLRFQGYKVFGGR